MNKQETLVTCYIVHVIRAAKFVRTQAPGLYDMGHVLQTLQRG